MSCFQIFVTPNKATQNSFTNMIKNVRMSVRKIFGSSIVESKDLCISKWGVNVLTYQMGKIKGW